MTNKTQKKDALDAHLDEAGIDPNTDHDMQQFSRQINIAEMIYSARQKAGLTQTQLAEAIGTKQQVISQLENADYEGNFSEKGASKLLSSAESFLKLAKELLSDS